MDTKNIVMVVLIGLVAGWLASFIVGGGGLIRYLVWGLLGSVVGGFILPLAGLKMNLGNPFASKIATSTIGAIVVVLFARLIG
ncbi:MAG: GlsB/YeaQ/YmgE family stress response membrane protein [Pseudomonadota bacterium]